MWPRTGRERNKPEKLQPLLACGAEYFLETILETKSCALDDETCAWIDRTLKDPKAEIEEDLQVGVRLPKAQLPENFDDRFAQEFKLLKRWHGEDDCPKDIRNAR